MRIDQLRTKFREMYGEEAAVFRAPGRVNLIGEHTDYNEGFVMPAAIEFATWIAASARNDNRIVARSLQYDTALEGMIGEQRSKNGDWTDYCWGVVESLRRAGMTLVGANLLVDGQVPIGAGLSSSAAIEVASALALLAVSERTLSLTRVAQLCQAAENEYVGARCGIMDQFIACTGKSGQCVMLDCRSLEYRYAPIPAGVALVICNTMVKHSVATGEYNKRRAECEQGVELLASKIPGICALRDVSMEQLERFGSELPEVVRRRCRHIVSENARVIQAFEALKAHDLERVGRLMHESHVSMRDDYEISCAEVDTMVEIAQSQAGVIGARMTGGGFGGCTINLVRSDAADQFRAAIAKEYESRVNIRPDIYITVASDGAGRIA